MRRSLLVLAVLATALPCAEPLRTRTVTTTTGIEPDGAEKVVRWGRFDGGSYELGGTVASGQTVDVPTGATMPRMLAGGGAMTLHLPARTGAHWLRIRCAYAAADPVLAAQLGGETVFAERLIYEPENPAWSRPVEINRSFFVQPGAAAVLTLRNSGTAPLYFDAIQLERRSGNAVSPVLFGSYCAFNATLAWKAGSGWGGAAYVQPPGVASNGAVRVDTRFHLLDAPGVANRWAGLDYLYARYAKDFSAAPLHFSAFGSCPEWMADPASLVIAKAKGRPFNAVPDRAKFKTAVGEWLDRYGSRCAAIELMNEVDIEQFWIGTWAEYVTLCNDIIPLIRQKAPQARIFSAGLSMQKEGVLDAMVSSGMVGGIDWVANHCYAGQSSAWDIPNGTFEGHCLARGIAKPIFANEQGFVWKNAEWFTGPPAWTPQRQYEMTDRAMAKLTAAGQSRVLVFNSGGDDHPYSYVDQNGTARPGYQVILDYNRLNGPDARRLDVQMVDAAGGAISGLYCMASQSATAKRIVAVLNPCLAVGEPRVRLRVPLPDAGIRSVTASAAGTTSTVAATMATSGGATWLDLSLTVKARTILTIVPDSSPPRASITAPVAGAALSGTVTVTADASDDVAVAGVRLRLDGVDLGAEDTSAPYTAAWNTAAAAPGAHQLTAVARDTAGNLTTSAAVVVTVRATAPAITTQPASLAVDEGQPATFTVAASGSAPLTYTWKRNGSVVGGNSPTLAIASAHSSDAGTYTVTVANAGGSATSNPATLAVDAGGHGWSATYYGSTLFSGTHITRSDPRIDFAWGAGSPDPAIPADYFTARWRGVLTPAASATYTFHATSDDGVRLWVDGHLLIDQWHGQSATTWSGTIALTAGRGVLVVLEYLEMGGNASARLEWSSPAMARQVVPQAVVVPALGDDLPGGFSASDIGTAMAGSTLEAGGTWTVAGSGGDIWGASDGFRFVSTAVTGDVRITARLASFAAANAWSKAGVMIRSGSAANAAHAFTCATGGNGLAFQRRPAAGAASLHTAGPLLAAPCWVRLERIGNLIISSTSRDGITWSELRREQSTLGATVLVGLAVSSHQEGTLGTATFTGVEIVSAATTAN